MTINARATRFARLAALVIAAVSVARCGSSPTSPTANTVAGVALSMTSVQVGGSEVGTVSVTTMAPANGTSIALTSSAPAVATVQTPVLIPAGASSVTFNVAAVAAGTATITASLNGSSRQSAPFTVTAAPALTSILLSAPSVVGGNRVTGTVMLTAGAPAGGAVVSLTGTDPLTVPPSITVLAGLLSATFQISTRGVSGTISGTVTGSYGGTSAFATLSVTPVTVATAKLGVTGPTESDTCTLTNSGNTLNCTFDARASTAPGTIISWDWSYSVAATLAQTTTSPTLTMPAFSCSMMPPPPFPAGSNQNFTMIVTLTIHDSLGNVASVTDSGVRLLPQGTCGF